MQEDAYQSARQIDAEGVDLLNQNIALPHPYAL